MIHSNHYLWNSRCSANAAAYRASEIQLCFERVRIKTLLSNRCKAEVNNYQERSPVLRSLEPHLKTPDCRTLMKPHIWGFVEGRAPCGRTGGRKRDARFPASDYAVPLCCSVRRSASLCPRILQQQFPFHRIAASPRTQYRDKRAVLPEIIRELCLLFYTG